MRLVAGRAVARELFLSRFNTRLFDGGYIMAIARFASICGASLAALLALGTAGCSSSDRDDRISRDRDRYDDPILSGERVERDSDASRKLPRDANIVDEGRGSLRYNVRDRGIVYVYDVDAATVVWNDKVDDGDRVSVDPDKNKIEINGREATKIDLKSDHRFRIYFLRGR